MKALRSGLDPDEFERYIKGKMITADLGAPDLYGYGLIDAHQAAAVAMETDPPPAISVIPRAVRLDAFESTAGLYVREVGAGGSILYGPTVEPDWLSAAFDGDQDGFGRYTLSVDRLNRNLAGGVHTGTVSFAYDGRSAMVPVTVDVLPDRAASAAPQYIQLVDAETNAVVDQLVVLPRDGVYPFRFSRVKPGSYYLRSSSDIDNNYRLKDQGEAVGAYPSLAGSAPFAVRSSMTGLDFVTGFQQWPFLEPPEQTGIAKRQTPGGGFQ
jgi:serine protease